MYLVTRRAEPGAPLRASTSFWGDGTSPLEPEAPRDLAGCMKCLLAARSRAQRREPGGSWADHGAPSPGSLTSHALRAAEMPPAAACAFLLSSPCSLFPGGEADQDIHGQGDEGLC